MSPGDSPVLCYKHGERDPARYCGARILVKEKCNDKSVGIDLAGTGEHKVRFLDEGAQLCDCLSFQTTPEGLTKPCPVLWPITSQQAAIWTDLYAKAGGDPFCPLQ